MIEFITSKMTIWIRPAMVSSVLVTDDFIHVWSNQMIFMFSKTGTHGTKEEGYQLLELLRPYFGVKETISNVALMAKADAVLRSENV